MSGYFWSYGRCKHCGWPHHERFDVAARPDRRFLWWRRDGHPARSVVVCCNCRKRTEIKPRKAGPVEACGEATT